MYLWLEENVYKKKYLIRKFKIKMMLEIVGIINKLSTCCINNQALWIFLGQIVKCQLQTHFKFQSKHIEIHFLKDFSCDYSWNDYAIYKDHTQSCWGNREQDSWYSRTDLMWCTYMNFYNKDYINIHTTNLLYVPFVILLSKFITNILL